MDRDWIKLKNRFSRDYIEGVSQFMEVAKRHVNDAGKTSCPCRNCQNSMTQSLNVVEQHLFTYGISPLYSKWVYHGEAINLGSLERGGTSSVGDGLSRECNADDEDDDIFGLLTDLQGPMIRSEENTDDEEDFEDEIPENVEEMNTSNIFDDLMDEARNQLYPGCTKFSSLNFLVKLMHIKVLNNWSNKSFNMLLELLKDAFPIGTSIPGSFYEAKRKLRDLKLGYDSIHACKYDCVLFWKELANCQSCPVCGESRYKTNSGKGKKIPNKVLRHFPLIIRLKRLFLSKHIAFEMR